MRLALLCALVLGGCRPEVGTQPDLDPGTCDNPAEGAIVGVSMQSRVSLLVDGHAADCETDLQCDHYESFEAAEPFEEGAQVRVVHRERDCVCEEVGPGTFDGHCDDPPPATGTLWIETVADDCITGAVQGPGDERPRLFVATVCCTGVFC